MEAKRRKIRDRNMNPSYKLLCADYSNPESLKKVLAEGAKVNCRNRQRRTPLHLAVMSGCAESVRLILSKKPDIDQNDEGSRSALSYAAQLDTSEILRMLLDAKEHIILHDHPAELAVAAMRWKDLELLRRILDFKRKCKHINMDLPTRSYLYPIFVAMRIPDPTYARLMLENGAKANKLRYRDGMRPLHLAIQKGSMEVIKLLLEYGAYVNTKTPDNATALHLAVQNYRADQTHEIVKALLKRGADCNQLDAKKKSAFWYSLEHCDRSVNELFLEHGADLKQEDWEVLQLVLLNPDEGVLDLLIEKNFRIDTRKYGQTALHSAVMRSQVKACRMLLERGADPTCKSWFNKTPLMELISHPNIDIRDLLIHYMAKWQVTKGSIADVDKMIIENLKFSSKKYEACVAELREMGRQKLHEKVTLYDLLITDEKGLAEYAKNWNLVDAFEKKKESLEKTFSIYFPGLRDAFSRELQKMREINEGVLDLTVKRKITPSQQKAVNLAKYSFEGRLMQRGIES